jgi:hypothetical protein
MRALFIAPAIPCGAAKNAVHEYQKSQKYQNTKRRGGFP